MNLHKRHYSAQADLSVVVRQHPRERPCTNLSVPEMLAENFMNNGSTSFREFLLQFVKSQASNLSNFPSFFPKSSNMRIDSPHCSRSWPSIIRHSTLLCHTRHNSQIATISCCLWKSIVRTFFAFKKTTESTSLSVRLLTLLFILNTQ